MLDYGSRHDTPITLGTALGLLWAAAFEKEDGRLKRSWVIGPVFYRDVSLRGIEQGMQYYSRLETSVSWTMHLYEVLKQVPVLQNTILDRYTLMLHYCLTGEYLTISDINSEALPAAGEPAAAPAHDRHKVWMAEQGLLQMVRTGAFYLMLVTFTCGLVAGMIVISQASPILQQAYGFPAAQAALFVSVFAACNMAGRFLWGSLSDKLGLKPAVAAVSVLCILSMLALALVGNTVVALCAMGLAASCYGGFASVLTPLTAQVFGPRYITENYGVMYLMFGIAGLLGPRIAVTLNNNGDYSRAFLVGCILAVISLIAAFLVRKKVKSSME